MPRKGKGSEPDRGDALGRMIAEGVWRQIEESFASGPSTTPAKPEGIVTILFTDVEGSTELLHRLGDQAAHAVLRRHDIVLRRAFEDHGGIEVEHPGDAFMVAFPTATRSVECALALQPALDADAAQRSEEPILVRVGMDTGEVIAEETGYFGRTVFRASRIADLAAGGRVLVSETTRLVADPALFAFQDLGERSLKGLGGAHRVFEAGPLPALLARERRDRPVLPSEPPSLPPGGPE
jgi:class 3 adenylate cyclase